MSTIDSFLCENEMHLKNENKALGKREKYRKG
jgi:hypothetical protein